MIAESRMNILIDGTAESRLADILFIMEDETFGFRKSASIVGGRGRLTKLIVDGKVRCEKPLNVQNAKCYCNASDVLRHAKVRVKRQSKRRTNEKDNHKRAAS